MHFVCLYYTTILQCTLQRTYKKFLVPCYPPLFYSSFQPTQNTGGEFSGLCGQVGEPRLLTQGIQWAVELNYWGKDVWVLSWGTYLSFSLIVQTGSGPANPSSYPMYKGLKEISFLVKQPQHEANQWPQYYAQGKSTWIYSYTLPHIFNFIFMSHCEA